MKKNLKKLHIFASGRVQNVFFRDNTRRIAKKLDLTGWVRNLDDGRVEIVAEGDTKGLEKLLDWVKRGSLLARVQKVEKECGNFSGQFKEFIIKYS